MAYTPGIDVCGNAKYEYKNGDRVAYDLKTGDREFDTGTGTIRGLAVNDLIDIWIVEFDEPERYASYGYQCAVMPHHSLRLL
jgi:hypothetical protein